MSEAHNSILEAIKEELRGNKVRLNTEKISRNLQKTILSKNPNLTKGRLDSKVKIAVGQVKSEIIKRAVRREKDADARLKQYLVEQERINKLKSSAANYRLVNTKVNVGQMEQNVRASIGVPVNFANRIAEALTTDQEKKPLKYFDRGQVSQEIYGAGLSVLESRVRGIVTTHRNAYISYLDSLDKILSEPNTAPAQYSPAPNQIRPVGVRTTAEVLGTKVSTYNEWASLSPNTRDGAKDQYLGKKQLGPKARNFWHHTGELSRAFHNHVISQKKLRVFPKSKQAESPFFTKPIVTSFDEKKAQFTSQPLNLAAVTKATMAEKHEITFKLRLPGFRTGLRSTSEAIEKLIIEPYLTGTVSKAPKDFFQLPEARDEQVSQQILNLKSNLRKLGEQIKHETYLRDSIPASKRGTKGQYTREIKKMKAAYDQQVVQLRQLLAEKKFGSTLQLTHSLDRMVGAEAQRPFIARLSLKAGKLAREKVKNTT